MEKKKSHNNAIQFLRFLFALFICFGHTLTVTALANYAEYKSLSIHINGSFLAVQYFFILSGFFLIPSLKKNVEDFVKLRIIRLWPAMAFSILVMLLLKPLHIYYTTFHSSDFATLLFLQGTGLSQECGLNGCAWFVCVLFFVSTIYFILMKMVKTNWIMLCIVALVTLVTGSLFISSMSISIRDIIYSFISVMMLWGFYGIGLGILSAKLNEKLTAVVRLSDFETASVQSKIICSVLEFAALAYICYFSLIDCGIPYPYNPLLPTVLFIILLLLFVNKAGILSARLLNSSICNRLGNISYNISYYLYIMQHLIFTINYIYCNTRTPPGGGGLL